MCVGQAAPQVGQGTRVHRPRHVHAVLLHEYSEERFEGGAAGTGWLGCFDIDKGCSEAMVKILILIRELLEVL